MRREAELVDRLRAAGCVFAEDEASLLIAAADEPNALEQLVVRRIAGEPLEQVLGWAEFGGVRLHVEPGVFVPRRRTEYLAGIAAQLAREQAAAAGGARRAVVVDLCCGVGAIGAMIADVAGPVDLVAADIDPAAVRAARRNLEPRGARVFEGDLFDALPDDLHARIDVLAVNAPYVPTDEIALMPPEARDHEARIALDGGGDGLDVHRRVAACAARWLAPGGFQVIETSDGLPMMGFMAEHQFAATGFAGNGLTFGTLGAMMARDAATGVKNPWRELFDAGRTRIAKGLGNYLSENKDYPYYLVRDRVAGPEGKSLRALGRGQGKILELDGTRVAAYRGDDGEVTLLSPVCTHLGCLVAWNDAESSWDCPCHGSRFTATGKVMGGPAETPLAPGS